MLADNDTHDWIQETADWDRPDQLLERRRPDATRRAYERLQREEWGSSLW